MNKQEFIEKLKMHGAWCTDCHDINGEKDRYVKVAKVRELLEQLDEPQAEKVEITERQERLLKKYEDEPFHRLLNNCRTDDEYLLARARLNGYTVKQEQKYRVRVNGRIVKHLQFLKDNQINSFTENGTPMTFTDKSKAEAVATLVEGSVEEI